MLPDRAAAPVAGAHTPQRQEPANTTTADHSHRTVSILEGRQAPVPPRPGVSRCLDDEGGPPFRGVSSLLDSSSGWLGPSLVGVLTGSRVSGLPSPRPNSPMSSQLDGSTGWLASSLLDAESSLPAGFPSSGVSSLPDTSTGWWGVPRCLDTHLGMVA